MGIPYSPNSNDTEHPPTSVVGTSRACLSKEKAGISVPIRIQSKYVFQSLLYSFTPILLPPSPLSEELDV